MGSLIWLDLKTIMILFQRRRWHPTPVLLPGKSHGWRSLVGCSPWGHEESDTTEWLPFHFSLSCIGEGNGNPLQCSCLENPRDGGACWAAFYGVAQSRTWLKRLSSSMVLFNRVLMILLSYIFTQLSLTFTFFLAWLHVYKIIIHLLISPIFLILILTCNTQWIPIFLLVYLCFIALLIF